MFVSEAKIQVRYAETDMMGVVYHANYLIWMEIARAQFIKDLGFSYEQMEEAGYVAPVIDVQASYKNSVVYGEEVTIKVWIEKYSTLRTTYGYEMYKPNGVLACTGTTSHVVVSKENFRPIALKKIDQEWHEAYEQHKKQLVLS